VLLWIAGTIGSSGGDIDKMEPPPVRPPMEEQQERQEQKKDRRKKKKGQGPRGFIDPFSLGAYMACMAGQAPCQLCEDLGFGKCPDDTCI